MLRPFALLVLLFAALPATAQRAPDAPPALERWRELPPERRAALRERFQAFQQLDEAQRAELRARHERLREAERGLDAQLAPLEPAQRREFLRRHLARESDRCGERLSERLSEAEREALAALPPDERRAKLFELHRRRIEERVERDGPPPWIAPEEWRALRQLDDREFFARLRAHRPPEGRDGPPLRPDPAWLDEIASLPEAERRVELERRLAARALDWLERHPEVPLAAELETLRALPPAELLGRLREAWRAHGLPRRGEEQGSRKARGS
jgi:hypothetical protein